VTVSSELVQQTLGIVHGEALPDNRDTPAGRLKGGAVGAIARYVAVELKAPVVLIVHGNSNYELRIKE
jgi:hypothetical protein